MSHRSNICCGRYIGEWNFIRKWLTDRGKKIIKFVKNIYFLMFICIITIDLGWINKKRWINTFFTCRKALLLTLIINFSANSQLPCHVGRIGCRSITEVKQRWDWTVHGWVINFQRKVFSSRFKNTIIFKAKWISAIWSIFLYNTWTYNYLNLTKTS